MALKITNHYGVYELEGNVEGANTLSLKHHFEALMTSSERIILSLDKVKSIDAHGVQVLTNLYERAIRTQRVFYLIGSKDKMIHKALSHLSFMIR